MVPPFSDWKISQTFSSIFFLNLQYFSVFLFNEFNKYKIYLTDTLQLNNSENNKKWLNFPHFPVFWVKCPHFFPVFWVKFHDFTSPVQKFPDWKRFSHFSRVSSPYGNQVILLSHKRLIIFNRYIKVDLMHMMHRAKMTEKEITGRHFPGFKLANNLSLWLQ